MSKDSRKRSLAVINSRKAQALVKLNECEKAKDLLAEVLSISSELDGFSESDLQSIKDIVESCQDNPEEGL